MVDGKISSGFRGTSTFIHEDYAMKFTFEIEPYPGEAALFVAGVTLEYKQPSKKGYWGLHITWWLLKNWRDWLWSRQWDAGYEDGWSLYATRLLGFEVSWERRRV